MIKLIVSDIDGTLLNDAKEFAPDFFENLEKLQKENVKFVAASGRSQYTLEKVFHPFERDIIYISDNGGYIKGNSFEKVIMPMTEAQVHSTVETCLNVNGLQVIMCAKDRAYFVCPDMEYIPVISHYYINYEIIDDYRKVNEEILKVAVHDPFGSAKNGYPSIKDKLDEHLSAVVSAYDWLDVMNKDLNKGVAVKFLQDYFNIAEDETLVFGDFNNDIEMLKCAKYSYAMDNASDTVKEAANYIAPSNNDFGVSKVIKEYVLEKYLKI